jgi:hypothetical protein
MTKMDKNEIERKSDTGSESFNHSTPQCCTDANFPTQLKNL